MRWGWHLFYSPCFNRIGRMCLYFGLLLLTLIRRHIVDNWIRFIVFTAFTTEFTANQKLFMWYCANELKSATTLHSVEWFVFLAEDAYKFIVFDVDNECSWSESKKHVRLEELWIVLDIATITRAKIKEIWNRWAFT